MYRFFCPSENIFEDKIIIKDKREIHHILNVMRLKKSDELIIFDGKNFEYRAKIREVLPKNLILEIEEKRFVPQKEELEITLACTIPKRKKFDLIVEKLTELGVKRIIPLKSTRSQVLLNKDKEKDRLQHWQRIALSSAKQSKRITIPEILPQTEFKEILSRKKEYDLGLVCTIYSETKKIREILKEKLPKKILILIGPEGDFTFQEVDLAIKEGFIPTSLGDLVLRTETAAIAVCSFLRLYAYS